MILVVGVPGAGKTFFARQFAVTYGAPIVSEDRVRYTLFANHTYKQDENVMVAQVSSLITEQLFTAGKTFIIDGGYNSETSRTEIAKIAAKREFRTLVVWVQTDMATAKQRAIRRNPKIVGDRYMQSLTTEQFDAMAKRFTRPRASDNVVVVSGKHNYSAQARVVLNKLAAGGAEPNQSKRSVFIR